MQIQIRRFLGKNVIFVELFFTSLQAFPVCIRNGLFCPSNDGLEKYWTPRPISGISRCDSGIIELFAIKACMLVVKIADSSIQGNPFFFYRESLMAGLGRHEQHLDL